MLDITDNALVIDYTGASPASSIRDRILSGRGGSGLSKPWNGPGITSSTAAQVNATASDSRSIGYAENALLPLGSYAKFRGQAVDQTSVLIAYTRTADANLDGVVNNDDVTVVGANFAPGAAKPAWALGDFEYNGSVDNDDVTLLGVFYNPAATPAPVPAVVPLPAPPTAGRVAPNQAAVTARETVASDASVIPASRRLTIRDLVWEQAPAHREVGVLRTATVASNAEVEHASDEELISLLAESIAVQRGHRPGNVAGGAWQLAGGRRRLSTGRAGPKERKRIS